MGALNYIDKKIDNGFSNGMGKDYTISIVRFVALVLIISCHMLQYFRIELAWWLNVGVQVFLCISGYLYGQRNTPPEVDFYRQRFKKILIPYYIVFCIASTIYFLFARNKISLLLFLKGLLGGSTLNGGGHLWFIRMIITCYILTPLLGKFRDYYVKDARSFSCFTIICVVLLTLIFGSYANSLLNPAWIGCYVIGYCLGINERNNYISWKSLLTVIAVPTILGNGIQIYINYIAKIKFSGMTNFFYRYFQDYNHVFLGVFIFLMLKVLLENKQIGKNARMLLDFSDTYSYETYLVHQFIILGPFSLMALTRSLPVNILIILLGIGLLTLMLKKIEDLIEEF